MICPNCGKPRAECGCIECPMCSEAVAYIGETMHCCASCGAYFEPADRDICGPDERACDKLHAQRDGD